VSGILSYSSLDRALRTRICRQHQHPDGGPKQQATQPIISSNSAVWLGWQALGVEVAIKQPGERL